MARTQLASAMNEPPKDEAELKRQALEIYKALPVARHATVAERIGVPIETVKLWIKEGGWLALRDQHHKQELAELFEQIESPQDDAIGTLKVCQRIRARLSDFVDGEQFTSPSTLAQCAEIVSKLMSVSDKAYSRLKLT